MSNSVRRYKQASDAIKHKASRIIQGAKNCFASKLSQKKKKRSKCVSKVVAESSKHGDVSESSNSNQDFIPSQNLRSYKGNTINDGIKIVKHCENVVQGPSDNLCNMLSEITKGKLKRIKVNIEIVNNTDSN